MKNKNTIQKYFHTAAASFGLAMMWTSALVGLVELHSARAVKAENHMQPAFALITEEAGQYGEHQMRREKGEHPHEMVSYGITMRSHPTSGWV